MKNRFRTLTASLLMLGFVLFLGTDATAQAFTPNPRADVSVSDMTVLKDKFEQHYTVTLDKATFFERLKVSNANYDQWLAVRNELQSNGNTDATEMQILSEFVEDMASKL